MFNFDLGTLGNEEKRIFINATNRILEIMPGQQDNPILHHLRDLMSVEGEIEVSLPACRSEEHLTAVAGFVCGALRALGDKRLPMARFLDAVLCEIIEPAELEPATQH